MADPGGSSETLKPVMTPLMFPGFRFSPTDVQLITYYLKNKLEGLEKSVEIITEVDFSRHEPWDLPGQSIMESDNEWFFFSARGRKYPNGLQSKRATAHGYWKATGKERNVNSGSDVVGTKRTLVFHTGRAPKGERTEWTMHEYCMEGRSQIEDLVVCRLRKNLDFRGSSSRNPPVQGHSSDSHSAENVDSISENDQNLPNLTTLVGPSTLVKDSDEDCFSDILKDDIVKLDESSSSLPAAEFLLAGVASEYEHVPAVATMFKQHVEQAPPERYMCFLRRASHYKIHCVVQRLSSVRTCISLLVLFVSFLVARKPLKMSLELLKSSITCADHT